MTKGQLLAILYERLNYSSSPATDVTTRLGNHLNQAHRMILRDPGVSSLRDYAAAVSFTSESGVSYYGLPPQFTSIVAITDRTNDRRLTPLALSHVRAMDPGQDAGGPPYGYVVAGIRRIARIPAGTGIWAVSSSASDTAVVAQINGIRSGGYASGDVTATLTGTSRVALGSFTDYQDIITVSLSVAAVGAVSLYDAAVSGNVLSVIPIGQTTPEYLGINLYPTPSSAVTYYVDGFNRILDMDDTVDIPQLPEDFHDLLIPAALMLEYEKADDPRYQRALLTYTKGLSDLKYYLMGRPDSLPVMGSTPLAPRHSRLGGWYPADF